MYLFTVLPDEDQAPLEVTVVEIADSGMCFLGGLVLHHGTPLRPSSGLLEQVHELDVSGLRVRANVHRIVWIKQNIFVHILWTSDHARDHEVPPRICVPPSLGRAKMNVQQTARPVGSVGSRVFHQKPWLLVCTAAVVLRTYIGYIHRYESTRTEQPAPRVKSQSRTKRTAQTAKI